MDTDLGTPKSDSIRPVLQATAVLEMYFCADFNLHSSVSIENGGEPVE